MPLTPERLAALADLAGQAAREAAALIAAFEAPLQVEEKAGGSSRAAQVVTQVDLASQAAILARLTPTLYSDDLALLSEERVDDGSRHHKAAFWCIDPLDGTLAFIEGKPGYAVSIALIAHDGTPLIGVVCEPRTGTLYRAVRGQGASRAGDPWRVPSGTAQRSRPLTLICDRSLAEAEDFAAVVARLGQGAAALGLAGVDLVHDAGAVMNACWVAERAPALYFKRPKPTAGGGSVWDVAATACLLTELGAVATDFSGERLRLNPCDTLYLHRRGLLFASAPELAEGLQAYIPHDEA